MTWITLGPSADTFMPPVRAQEANALWKWIGAPLFALEKSGVEVRAMVRVDGEASIRGVRSGNVRVLSEHSDGEEVVGWTLADPAER